MNAPYQDKTGEDQTEDLDLTLQRMGAAARAAARVLANTDKSQRAAALRAMAQAVLAHEEKILAANARDIDATLKSGASAAFADRLKLTAGAIQSMANGIETVAWLPDPIERREDVAEVATEG